MLDTDLRHPSPDEIIHCMQVNNRTNYFERQKEFVEIRWYLDDVVAGKVKIVFNKEIGMYEGIGEW